MIIVCVSKIIIFFFCLGFIQPDLIEARLQKVDTDGMMARHWIVSSNKKKTYFRDIGPKASEEMDLSVLFIEVFRRHSTDYKVKSMILRATEI